MCSMETKTRNLGFMARVQLKIILCADDSCRGFDFKLLASMKTQRFTRNEEDALRC